MILPDGDGWACRLAGAEPLRGFHPSAYGPPLRRHCPGLAGDGSGLERNTARGGPYPQRPSRVAPIETLPRPRPRRRLWLGSAVARRPSLGLRLPPHFRPLHRPPFRARAFAAAAPVRAAVGVGPAPALRAGCGSAGGSALGLGGCHPRAGTLRVPPSLLRARPPCPRQRGLITVGGAGPTVRFIGHFTYCETFPPFFDRFRRFCDRRGVAFCRFLWYSWGGE